MKRWVFLFLTAVAVLSIGGCKSRNIEEDKNISPYQEQAPTREPTVTQAPVQNNTESRDEKPENTVGNQKLRFIVLADSRGLDHGVNSEIVNQVLKQVKQLTPQPEFALLPGDLTEGSKSYSEVQEQLDYFKEITTQYYPVGFYYPGIGNHEMRAGKGGEKAFSKTFSEFEANFLEGYHRTSYYFDVGDTRFFMLNSNHPGEKHKITGNQLTWLKNNIDPEKKHTIFLMHEPPYPTGAEAGNSLDSYPASRDEFWQVVDETPGAIVFCGHEHNYSRRLIDSSFNEKIGKKSYEFRNEIFQIITGGFGAPLYTKYTSKKNMIIPPIPQYHFTVVDIDANGVSIQAINMDGEIIDSFLVE